MQLDELAAKGWGELGEVLAALASGVAWLHQQDGQQAAVLGSWGMWIECIEPAHQNFEQPIARRILFLKTELLADYLSVYLFNKGGDYS